jgi:hypothetical protein
VRESAVIHSDETTSRVGGNTWWEWVFCTPLLSIRYDEKGIYSSYLRIVREAWKRDRATGHIANILERSG